MESLIGAIPDDWRQVPLGDLYDIKSGPSGALRSHPITAEDSGVPVVTTKDLRFNVVSMHGLMFVKQEVASRLLAYQLLPGDIVCTRTGELGRQALISDAQSGWLYGTACMRLRPMSEQTTPGYLLYYLGHPAVMEWVRRNATGSTIPSISARVLTTLPLVVPPLDVQTDISQTLRLLDAKAALHDEITRTTTALRDSLLPALYAGSRPAIDDYNP